VIAPFLRQIGDVWQNGGLVMPSLVGSALVLWFTHGQRMLLLRRGDRRPLRVLLSARLAERVERPEGGTGSARVGSGVVDEAVRRGARLWREHGGPVPRSYLEEAFGDLEDSLRTGNRLVACLVAMAPLLGLLGTVTGLIETFGSLGQSSTSAASEGIAGGIVEALYATQMGLAVAVPGLLMGGLLRHRQQKLELELDELKELLEGAWREAA
jgi:biopolymer transport protein ExbB